MGSSLDNRRPRLWVWKFQPVLRQGGVARFFFMEDVDEFDRSTQQFFTDWFKKACVYVGHVRVYQTYVAVQWNIEDSSIKHEDVAGVVVQAGCELFSYCFGWINPCIDFGINSHPDVRKLARQEGCPERWNLGV